MSHRLNTIWCTIFVPRGGHCVTFVRAPNRRRHARISIPRYACILPAASAHASEDGERTEPVGHAVLAVVAIGAVGLAGALQRGFDSRISFKGKKVNYSD